MATHARKGRLEVTMRVTGKWYWRRRAPNGQIAGRSSEGYTRRADAIRGAKREYPELAGQLVRVITPTGVHSR